MARRLPRFVLDPAARRVYVVRPLGEDGWAARFHIGRLDEFGGPTALEIVYTGPDRPAPLLTAAILRRLSVGHVFQDLLEDVARWLQQIRRRRHPLAQITRDALQKVGLTVPVAEMPSVKVVGERRSTALRLARVAVLYGGARRPGRPVHAVADALAISYTAARDLVRRARLQGYLPLRRDLSRGVVYGGPTVKARRTLGQPSRRRHT